MSERRRGSDGLGTGICTRAEYEAHLATGQVANRFRLERHLAERHRDETEFSVDAICEVDGEPVSFLVDRLAGSTTEDGLPLPNWRERLVCPRCQLNCRQRAMLATILRVIRGLDAPDQARVYAMERITPLYSELVAHAPSARCVGSEFLGESLRGGEIVKGVRHENVEQLSFEDDSFDIIFSNDVLEHVAHPRRALSEAVRVLRAGGLMLFTIPFDTSREASRTRAVWRPGEIEHLLPPEYHGDPVTGRSLVYTDFGWDSLEWCREAGFRRCTAVPYWSLEFGYLGAGHLLFRAEA